MLAKDVMSNPTASISPTATVMEAASLLVNTDAGALAVINDRGNLVGFVSEVDVLSHLTSQSNQGNHIVSEFMTKDVISVDETNSLKAAIELMLAKRLKIVPVCREGVFVGMLRRAEVMRLIVSRVGTDPASNVQDNSLRHDVVAAMKGHPWSLAQRFDVVVKDGVVHLWGVVPNAAVHSAYCEAAEKVPQAKSVVSHMHVMPHGVRMSNLF